MSLTASGATRMREGEEILAVAHQLEGGRYVPEPGRVFVTEHPKHREVRVPRLGPVAGPVRVTWIDEPTRGRLRALWASDERRGASS